MAEPFGKYLLHEKIAQGGMAEVFLATREGDIGGFKRRLAIKRMFSHLVDREEIINMFIDEARIAARLNHPNIVQIYDLGVVDDTFFIAMEYVDGLDLRRICEMGVKQKHFISRPLAVHIATQVAMGLDYAHKRTDEQGRAMNIVHRDVSPQNVLVSTDGAVKVCDFGIAKAENRLTDTQVGEFKGKFSYMSPEQFGHDDLDHRSDIFTLGIVLYETTVGARLFRAGSEYETMQKVTDGDFHPPRRVRPDYPPQLEAIVLKALATDPDDRYQSAGALQKELEDWLFEQRVRTGPRQLADYVTELSDLADTAAGGGDRSNGARQEPMERPEPPSSLVEEVDDEEEDPTVQVALSPEQMRMLGREDELEEAADPLEVDDDDPTVQMEVSRAEIEELRRTVNQDDDVDETVQDMDPPEAVAQMRGTSGNPVEVRRDVARSSSGRLEGNSGGRSRRESTVVEGELDEETTSPMDTPGASVIDEDDGASGANSQDITGNWTGRRSQEGPGEGVVRPEVHTPGRSGRGTAAGAEVSGGAPKSPPTGPDGGAAAEDEVAVSADEGGADDVLDEMPDLTPGGRELTGLNVVQRQSEAARTTTPVPTVGKRDEGIFDANRSLIIIGAVAAVTLIVGLGLVAIIGGGDEDEETDRIEDRDAIADEEEPAPRPAADYETVGDAEITLSLDSDPSGVAVVVNGVLQDGETPMETSLVDGRDNEVWLIRSRYRPKRLLIPAEGEELERSVELERAAATDDVEVTFSSTPEGATVWINGEEAPFETPVTMDARVDFPTHVQFVKEGYRPHVAFVDFSEDEDRLEVRLSADDQKTVSGDYGFRPRGSRVYLGGAEMGDTPFELRHHGDEWLALEVDAEGRQPRHHRLRTDQIGGFTLAMELEREARKTGLVTLNVEPTAAVYVDARAFGSSPVEEVELPAGEQTVVLESRDGNRVRVPVDVEIDEHLEYHIELDGGDAEVARVE